MKTSLDIRNVIYIPISHIYIFLMQILFFFIYEEDACLAENYTSDISRRFINSDGASCERQLADAIDTTMKINDCLAK